MKPAILNSGAVDSAFRTLKKRLKQSCKKINVQAARQMKSGDYAAAQKWMDIGRSVTDFGERVQAFGDEWKRLAKAARLANAAKLKIPKLAVGGKRSSKTPAWKFCSPALKSIVSRSGTAKTEDVLLDLEQSMATVLTVRDREPKFGRGMPAWHVTLKKAYRQCQREGWIEKRTDGIWKITKQGEAVHEQDSTGDTNHT